MKCLQMKYVFLCHNLNYLRNVIFKKGREIGPSFIKSWKILQNPGYTWTEFWIQMNFELRQ